MSSATQTLRADAVIAGSGPGGATIARELARKGKKVILCEAGRHNRHFGLTVLTTVMMDRLGFTFSQEGTWVVRPKTLGGASVVFCGTAFKPPKWLKERYDIDLTSEIDELYAEIPIRPLPDSLVGPAARRIMESARDLGFEWNLLDKWIRPEKCKPNCGGCFLGCRHGARWTAREYIQEAQAHGATVLLRTRVHRVLTEGGKAVGVLASGPSGEIRIEADRVILSAGGQGTPPILQRSGLHDAGRGLFADPLWLVVGPADVQGSKYDIPMTAGTNLEQEGIVMTDALSPPLFYAGLHAFNGLQGLSSLPKALKNYTRTLGIMVKVRDGLEGRVNLDESFSKPLDGDVWAKLNKGAVLAEQILLKAGVKREDLMKTCILAAHPGGTVRIGELLDRDCQTEIRGCYCMDASVLPEPWGLPPTVTIVALAKRLAKRLYTPQEAEAASRVSGST